MPWKGLKYVSAGPGNNDTIRDPTSPPPVDPPRRSENVPRQFTLSFPRLSESTANVSRTTDPKDSDDLSHISNPQDDRVGQEPAKRKSRFNLMRFRHASDPQLSASYKQAQQPPIPAIPPPPQIITTSPTSTSLGPSTKRRSVFKFAPGPARSEHYKLNGSHPTSSPNGAEHGDASSSQGMLGPQASSHMSFEEPGRRSTTSLRSSPVRSHPEQQWGLFPGTRLSESSKSDGSSIDPAAASAHSKANTPSTLSSVFRLPLIKRSQKPLFPLPDRPTHPNPKLRGGSNLKQSSDPVYPDSSADPSLEHLTPRTSPSRSSFGQAARIPGDPVPYLNRENSMPAPASGTPSSSVKESQSLARRGRSSTAGSLPDTQDDLGPSSRASTNTGPRKSFSDLFHLSHRMRHSTEPSRGVDASSATAASATPGSVRSKANSFSLERELAVCPPREPEDTAATYLEKLESTLHRKAIATVLSQSADEFYATGLRKYIRGFSFFGDPMDMAIRKFLMEAELPKETQQIDRVLQAFANRYDECNPGIFASPDQAYFIAFSLLILHTDVFNKNNKRKMQKQDYVRNTQGEGIAEDILECFYENICYTPFIHVEDELNLGSRLVPAKSKNPLLKVTNSDRIPRPTRDPVDPYAVILEGKLGSLRPNLKGVMELDDVYFTSGSGPSPSVDDLHQAFYKPCILQIVSARSRPDAFLTQTSIANPAGSQPGLVDIRVAKVGLLWRKDPKKKKTRSPWQEWGAVLTGSQLYFFRDVQWVKSLIFQYEAHQTHGSRRAVTFTPPVADFKPDATMSMADAVALLDSTYKKHKNAFLLVRHGGFEEVILANSEEEMNEWLATVNYAAAFRTTGVRMRGMIGANYEGRRSQTRADSVTSTSPERPTATDLAASANRKMDPRLVEEVFVARRRLVSQRIIEANEKLAAAQKQLDDQLRNARHLQVLTPVLPRARDQVVLAAGKMSAKIKWARTEIWRTKCHRDVLAMDLAEEERQLGISQTTGVDQSAPAALEMASPSTAETVSADIKSPTIAETASPSLASPPASDRPRSPEPSIDWTNREARRASVRRSLSPSEGSLLARKASSIGSRDISSVPPAMESPARLPRQTSIASRQSNLDGSMTTAPGSSIQETPAPSMIDDEEERFLRESGLIPAAGEAVDTDKLNAAEHRSKVRRSLQRSLREAHIPHHHRSKKGKDQAATAPAADDGQAAPVHRGLSRSSPSFTVHGKKASIVTFGSEWQNMFPEERLKQRKPMQPEGSRASEMTSTENGADSDAAADAKAESLNSVSVATETGPRGQDLIPEYVAVTEIIEEAETPASDADPGLSDNETAASAPSEAIEPSQQLADATSSLSTSNDAESRQDDAHTISDRDQLTEDAGKTDQGMPREKLGHVSPGQTVEA